MELVIQELNKHEYQLTYFRHQVYATSRGIRTFNYWIPNLRTLRSQLKNGFEEIFSQ